MAGLGFKDFQVGEVLTAADVDGYLMQQSVMRFSDAAARGSALGTAVGTGVPLAEGMVSYLDSSGLEVYSGSAWLPVGAFTAGTTITATDASWAVPALSNPIVRVTVVGGGGGCEPDAAITSTPPSGGSTTFACSAGTAVASGGVRASGSGGSGTGNGWDGDAKLRAGNGGIPGSRYVGAADYRSGSNGQGGEVVIAYLDLTGVATASVTVGAGDVAGTDAWDADGGDGFVIFEYRAA